MFVGWLVEAILFEIILAIIQNTSLYNITLKKFTDRINIMLSGKIIISSFIIFIDTRHRYIVTDIDATGFKILHASEYYTNRAKLGNKKYAKLSIGAADVLRQISVR